MDATQWDALLAGQADANPFMCHAYLAALHESGAAVPKTGWTPRFITLWRDGNMVAAGALYLKAHSYGEYVFDHAWAHAYQQHGLNYYPKAVVAVPFTPVPGARLLARTQADREALVQGLVAWCGEEKLSSLHLLFANEEDVAACVAAGLMVRHTVQFHWTNSSQGFHSFDDFLASLSQEKRKKIRQERRKVADAGVTFRWSLGADIARVDWDFFYRCYERTYLEHGNAPYLSRDFFQRMADTMPENWLLFVADREGKPIAASLIAVSSNHANSTVTGTTATHSNTTDLIATYAQGTRARGLNNPQNGSKFEFSGQTTASGPTASEPSVFEPTAGESSACDPAANDTTLPDRRPDRVAYGRYWGGLERVDCLHFEACYYQPLQWCIEHGYQRFEGGAQGEHKMARALMPVKTSSTHWLAQPAFADAVERFLAREGEGIDNYMTDLSQRSPFKQV